MRDYTPENVTDAVTEQMASTSDERFKTVMESLVRHLHDFAREVHLTPDEWMAGIEFLTRVGQTCTPVRQEFILLSDTLGLSTLVNILHDETRVEEATPTSNLGPFYREDSPVKELGDPIVEGDDSEQIQLYGKIRDAEGKPIPGAKVEIWQTSSRGTYDLQEGEGEHMDYRATFYTDDEGNYYLRTVRPLGYYIPLDGPVGDMIRAQNREGCRPAHIHYLVSAPGYREVITAIYLPDQYLETDTVFGAAADLVVPEPKKDPNAPIPDVPAIHFDLTLSREGEVDVGSGRVGGDPSKVAAQAS